MRSAACGLAFAIATAAATQVSAQNHPLTGDWIAEGERVRIVRCGEDFCAAIQTGDYAGTPIARVSGPGPTFEGTVVDPRENEQYDGALRLAGRGVELRGCLMEVFCRTIQTWRRP